MAGRGLLRTANALSTMPSSSGPVDRRLSVGLPPNGRLWFRPGQGSCPRWPWRSRGSVRRRCCKVPSRRVSCRAVIGRRAKRWPAGRNVFEALVFGLPNRQQRSGSGLFLLANAPCEAFCDAACERRAAASLAATVPVLCQSTKAWPPKTAVGVGGHPSTHPPPRPGAQASAALCGFAKYSLAHACMLLRADP